MAWQGLTQSINIGSTSRFTNFKSKVFAQTDINMARSNRIYNQTINQQPRIYFRQIITTSL